MTASEIARIVGTVGTVQLACNLAANYLVFRKEKYRKALSQAHRLKLKLEKERKSHETPPSSSSGGSSKQAEKAQKRLKRVENEYSDAVGYVARIHVAPNVLTSLVFIVLLRVLGTEYAGNNKVIGVLPFEPFRLLQKITARGVDFASVDAADFESSTPKVTSVTQGCAFLFVYLLSTFSIKFYVNKLFGTAPPPGSEGIMSFIDSPQGQRIMSNVGVDPNMLKAE